YIINDLGHHILGLLEQLHTIIEPLAFFGHSRRLLQHPVHRLPLWTHHLINNFHLHFLVHQIAYAKHQMQGHAIDHPSQHNLPVGRQSHLQNLLKHVLVGHELAPRSHVLRVARVVRHLLHLDHIHNPNLRLLPLHGHQVPGGLPHGRE
ncbi:50S ribosomal protein L17, partial [Striga asiatica]